MTTTTIKTFKISNNPQSINNAVTQCVAALIDMGCGSTIKRSTTQVRVTSEQPIENTQTGELSKVSFLLKLV